MPLAPGPFWLQSPGEVNFQVENYDFTDSVTADQSSIDALSAQIDLLLPDIAAFTAPIIEPVPGIDLDALQTAIDPGRFDFIDTSANEVIAAVDQGETALNLAAAAAPSQAWTLPAAPFVPDLALTLASPLVSGGAYQPGTTTSVGTQPQPVSPTAPTPAAPSVTLLNTTEYGNPNFTVGDIFVLTVTGPPHTEVTVTGTFNGNALGDTDFGSTDAEGNFQITNVMQTENVGAWTEQWYLGGKLVSNINFLVLPSPNPNI